METNYQKATSPFNGYIEMGEFFGRIKVTLI
jgi:hypothetical protein